MIMIIQIALGIVLAIVILAVLPFLVRAVGWALILLVVGGLLIVVFWIGSSFTRKDFAYVIAFSSLVVGPIVARALERPLQIAFGEGPTTWIQVAITLILVIGATMVAPLILSALSP